jgi:hypothetical protein
MKTKNKNEGKRLEVVKIFLASSPGVARLAIILALPE